MDEKKTPILSHDNDATELGIGVQLKKRFEKKRPKHSSSPIDPETPTNKPSTKTDFTEQNLEHEGFFCFIYKRFSNSLYYFTYYIRSNCSGVLCDFS